MTTEQDFSARQEQIYGVFRERAALVREEGTKPSEIIGGNGSYSIVMRWPEEIMESYEGFALRLEKTAHLYTYDRSLAHTTLFRSVETEDFLPDTAVLNEITRHTHSLLQKGVPSFNGQEVDFFGWLYNQDTVIVAGSHIKGLGKFVSATKYLMDACQRLEGVEWQAGWGAYMTAARFNRTQDPGELKEFFRSMDGAPSLGYGVPVKLDVCYGYLMPGELQMQIHESFTL